MSVVNPTQETVPNATIDPIDREQVTVRFVGDSGDGIQLAGAQFTAAAAMFGHGVFTVPDVPTEIRAPAGALAGVTGFQVSLCHGTASTPGDRVDVLVAMNPAALRTSLEDMASGGLIIANADAFIAEELSKAGYETNPLNDGTLIGYRVVAAPLNQLNRSAVAHLTLSAREADRCRNFFALGLVFKLFDLQPEPTLRWIRARFAKNPVVLEANSASLRAGYHHGETTSLPTFRVATSQLPAGRYRRLSGVDGLALGLVAAAESAQLPLVFACCPSHPASELLHVMAALKSHDVRCPQSEDEIAAAAMAIGAAFGGAIGVAATSGPGHSLQSEAIGLAVMAELPCVVIDLQRGGPSTGMPTKTEQADLLQALFGRHGESPLVVLAPSSPANCFSMAYEAVRLAIRYMTPVVLLGDVYLTIAAETWRIPSVEELPGIVVTRPAGKLQGQNGRPFLPYDRNDHLARPWAIPGTQGLEHRIGGLEKERATGHVNYDPLNHERMCELRKSKIAGIAKDVPSLEVHGAPSGELLVLGWGSTEGAITSAVGRARAKGFAVSSAHFRYLNPLPANTADVLSRFRHVLAPELNHGQLSLLLRSQFRIEMIEFHKLQGRPFLVSEIEAKIEEVFCPESRHP